MPLTSPAPPIPASLAPETGAPHHRVERLALKGTAYFEDTTFDFPPGLTCIIGELGTGKTTILQSIRYSIGAPATGERAKHNEDQATGTLGAGESTTEVCTQHGQGYVSRRRRGEPPRVTTADGAHAPVSLDSELFKIDFYSQHQIRAIVDKPSAQLELIDKFAGAEIRTLTDAIDDAERRLGLNAIEVVRLEREIEEGEHRTRDFPSLAAALESLSQASGPDAAEAESAHAAKVVRGREQGVLRAMREDQRAVLAAADNLATEARRKLGGEIPAPLTASVNQPILAPAHAQAATALAVVEVAVAEIRRALTEAGVALTAAGDALGGVHAAQDSAYDAIVRRHDADRGRVAERERLQGQFLAQEAVRKRLEDSRRARDARLAERTALQEERANALGARYAARRRVAAEISRALEGVLVVDVIAGGDIDSYKALLFELLKGANVRPQELIEEIANHIRPDDLAALVRANDSGPIQALDESKTGRAERAQRILDALRAGGRLGELETVRLGDVPFIQLQDGDDLIPSRLLSSGQQCTCVLPIILLLSANTLIIDQPEDQIDNAFIFRVLVPTLRRLQGCRQIIFATHNANIIVLGGSVRVIAVESVKRRGRVKRAGTLDEMRDLVEKHVEGGREAFLLRAARYGHTTTP